MEADNKFLSPVLRGARFEQHGIPLDVMKDFYIFDEMLKSVAKTIYKREHPDRKRLPRNFMNDISFQLTSIDEGSTIVNISMICLTASANLFSLPALAQGYAEKARDCIIRTIDAASHGKLDCSLPDYMNQDQLALFDRFGCSLQDDESIEFPLDGNNQKVILNRTVRRNLASMASRSEYRAAAAVYGAISELDQDKTSFILNTVDGLRLPVHHYNIEHTEDVINASSAYRKGQKVLVRGVGIYSPSDHLDALESIDSISLLDDIDFGYRLAEIGELKSGWLENRYGEPFDKERLNRLNDLFQKNYILDVDPYLFPAENDSLLAEWAAEDWRMSMEINLSSLTGNFYALNLKTDQDFEKTFVLTSPSQWQELCKIIDNPEKVVIE